MHKFLRSLAVVIISLTHYVTSLTLSFNPNLGGGGGILPPPCWFSLNNSETVKAITLAFCSIQKYFIRNNHAKFDILNSSQSPDIGQNSEGGIPEFQISGQSLIKENFHNSRASNDIDMKLGPVTKLDKRNKTTSKTFDNDIMSTNCDITVIFSIYGQFGATGSWIPDA